MRTVILGKKIENKYDVVYNWEQIKDSDGEIKTVYTDKPSIDKKSEVKEWVELCSYDGEPKYNSHKYNIHWFPDTLNISETETLTIEKEIFRADLNEMHLYTNKIVEEKDINKEETVSICNGQIREFNKMMIESNYTLKSYCDLHKLDYGDTDCIELFKLLFPDTDYTIENGVLKSASKPNVSYAPLVFTPSLQNYVLK